MTVLIADDEKMYRDTLARHIRSNQELAGRVHVIDARSPDEAFRIGLESNPDIVFLDIDFLGGASCNGFDVAASLRRRGLRSPICFHTNHPLEEVQRRGAKFDVEHYLAKPVTTEDLDRVVSSMLGLDDLSPAAPRREKAGPSVGR